MREFDLFIRKANYVQDPDEKPQRTAPKLKIDGNINPSGQYVEFIIPPSLYEPEMQRLSVPDIRQLGGMEARVSEEALLEGNKFIRSSITGFSLFEIESSLKSTVLF